MRGEGIPAELLHGAPFPAVTARMRALVAHFEGAGDPRCVFLDCYATMTGNMLAGLDGGRFRDGEWVGHLLERFSDYYFDALAAYEQGAAHVPAVWQVTHDATRRKGVTAVQHLLLGVNAHINYDLVLALRDQLAGEWGSHSPAARQQRFEDHMLVNQIIAETVDRVQDTIVERHMPLLDLVDRLGGPVDEWLTARVIGRWRREVWVAAEKMLDAGDAAAQEALRQELERRAVVRARLFLAR